MVGECARPERFAMSNPSAEGTTPERRLPAGKLPADLLRALLSSLAPGDPAVLVGPPICCAPCWARWARAIPPSW